MAKLKKSSNLWIIIIIIALSFFVMKKEATYIEFRLPEFGLSNIAYAPVCGEELVGYGYVGPSSYDCLPADIISTIGGYEICTRPGYVYDRLYMMEGTNGRYYKLAEFTEDSISLSPLPVTPEFEVACDSVEGQTITCSTNAECGTNGFTGTEYCFEGNVGGDYINYLCYLSGTTDSYCGDVIETRFVQDCETKGCTDGACLNDGICNTDADTSCNGIVSDLELLSYANLWLQGSVTDIELLQAAQEWLQ